MVKVRNIEVGQGQPVLIAGPCMLESRELVLRTAEGLRESCARRGFALVFKGSFDKANRTSLSSPRGPGLERGLAWLAEVREQLDCAVTTDVHLPQQCAAVAEVVDLLQVPAFLSRQTDLLVAAAQTGKPVNVKKGQWMAPEDLGPVVTKLNQSGAGGALVTERGTAFGYHRLVVDFAGFEAMRAVAPLVFDATHSAQRPGGLGGASGGDRSVVPALVRAALGVGVDALFVEVHPDPDTALSDAQTQLPLGQMGPLLSEWADRW